MYRALCAWRLTVCFAWSVLLVAGCEKKLPTAPSDLTSGIVVYEHANFQGRSALIDRDIKDLKDFDGPCRHDSSYVSGDTSISDTTTDWNDCMSSIRVAPGWRATIYRDDDFKGQSLQVTEDVPNLQLVSGTCSHDGLNDCITSIRVFRQ